MGQWDIFLHFPWISFDCYLSMSYRGTDVEAFALIESATVGSLQPVYCCCFLLLLKRKSKGVEPPSQPTCNV